MKNIKKKKKFIVYRLNLIIIVLLAVVSIFVAWKLASDSGTRYSTITSADVLDTTKLIFDKIGLDGIGNSGDSINPTDHSRSNKNPDLPSKKVKISIYDTSNNLAGTFDTTMAYDYDKGFLKATLELNDSFNGDYIIKLKTDGYLQKRIPGTIQIIKNTNVNVPAVSLVPGDLNGDNILNITDLNILLGCYTDIFPAKFCDQTRESLADISSDGHVNILDYNLFLRELMVVQRGD